VASSVLSWTRLTRLDSPRATLATWSPERPTARPTAA
jgi:hypothetical protein